MTQAKNTKSSPATHDVGEQSPQTTRRNMKQIVAAVERGEGEEKQTYWTRLGVAFENRDGSWNLRLDFFPTTPSTTLQLRDFEPRENRER